MRKVAVPILAFAAAVAALTSLAAAYVDADALRAFWLYDVRPLLEWDGAEPPPAVGAELVLVD